MGHRCCLLFATILSVSSLRAQDTGLSVLSKDSLTSADTLSVFAFVDSLLDLQESEGLLDSLIKLQKQSQSSQLALRLSYNSNVISAGRTLGIENFGITPSVSYFHKTGFYADISAYWSKDFEPSYYLTIASAGYMKDLSKHFSVMASFDKYFYRFDEGTYIPYRHTLSVTPVLDLKPISLSASYSFYFGDETAHRIMPSLGINLEKRNFWKVSRIAFVPTGYVLFGNVEYTTIEEIKPATLREAYQNFLKYGTRWRTETTLHKVFGVMNYAISIPLFVNYKNWSFNVAYVYNIPQALPGEPDVIPESSYVTGGILYLLDLSSSK